jgi:hypothetical protein
MATLAVFAQSKREQTKDIYKSSNQCQMLSLSDHLSNAIGSRLSGSAGAEKAVYILKRN